MQGNEITNFRVGRVVKVITERSFGFTYSLDESVVDFWLPRSEIEKIILEDLGETQDEDIRIGDMVQSVQIPLWLARDKDLETE